MNMNKLKKWENVRSELFSAEEIAESDLRVALIGELVKARREQGITQKQLEKNEWSKATGNRSHGKWRYQR